MELEQESPWICSICGARAARWSSDPVPVDFREGTFYVSGFTYEHCDACGEGTLAADQIDPINIAGVAVARAELGRLTSDDVHELRHALGLRQADLEQQMGVGSGTVGRWERGELLQSHMADNFMRLLWAHPELIDESGLVAREKRGPYRKRG